MKKYGPNKADDEVTILSPDVCMNRTFFPGLNLFEIGWGKRNRLLELPLIWNLMGSII